MMVLLTRFNIVNVGQQTKGEIHMLSKELLVSWKIFRTRNNIGQGAIERVRIEGESAIILSSVNTKTNVTTVNSLTTFWDELKSEDDVAKAVYELIKVVVDDLKENFAHYTLKVETDFDGDVSSVKIWDRKTEEFLFSLLVFEEWADHEVSLEALRAVKEVI